MDDVFYKKTLQKEMEAAGFVVSGFYGDVKGSPYDENSPSNSSSVRKKRITILLLVQKENI